MAANNTWVKIVLVSPLHAGNVGAVARVAANFDANEIIVVNPRCDLQAKEAKMLATGIAAENLAEVIVVDSLAEALTGCKNRIAFTCRNQTGSKQCTSLGEINTWFSGENEQTALVFGPEDSGLQSSDIKLCTHTCAISTSARKSSLNLSHAVAVVLSRYFETSLESTVGQKNKVINNEASGNHIDALMGQWSALLVRLKFVDRGGSDSVLQKIRDLLVRAHSTTPEINTLHVFLQNVANNLKDGL